MRYLSVCSGIEAATVAWHPLGWKPAAFAEIDKFPRAVLQHHYPEVPIHGDFTTIQQNDYGTVDLLVGGTPCQSFSVAGLRGGLDDDRGNLALEFMRLAARIEPTWIVWENVPGVLSSNGGRDFGSILGALGELGYGWAYRVLDAQHFGVPQRRRRVFVVGCTRGWQCAAAVLFEQHSVSGNPPPRREKREGVAAGVADCAGVGNDGSMIARCVTTGEGKRFDSETTTLFAFDWQTGGDMRGLDPKPTAQLQRCQAPAVALDLRHDKELGQIAPTMQARTNLGSDLFNQPAVRQGAAVRRLTPRECERLQGFPDDYTAIPWRGKPADQCPDGPRYKSLGNSMAVPVMRWIGRRIAAVTDTSKSHAKSPPSTPHQATHSTPPP
jgi:DNA (cytosine-5)-methyltransferase 1